MWNLKKSSTTPSDSSQSGTPLSKGSSVFSDGSSIEERLDELFELVEETNKTVRAMRREAIIGRVIRFFMWAIVIISAYVTIVNYLTPLLQTFSGVGEIKPTDINNLIDFYREQFSK
jgi:hypothetical protein